MKIVLFFIGLKSTVKSSINFERVFKDNFKKKGKEV